ncbi:MAG: alpha-ketoacid dehydrogenase subunit beta, partial [Pseudomonadales bacterium]|nr:alpha-ketoacid dehydrogenase subunit beta [Pseudomonadales bacterium]
KRIYRISKQAIEDNGEALPLDVCFTLREGEDITLISWGAMVLETLQAANKLEESGVSVEVIDVATISPLDMDTILSSVKKTGRCVIIHEAAKNCGVGAEISAQIAERALLSLQAPIKRVAGYDTIMPYFRNENYYMPSANDIVLAATETLNYE